MKKINLIYTLLLGLVMITTGCFDESGQEILFTESFVELNEATTGAGASITRAYQQAATPTATSVRVNLASRELSQPVTVTFEVSGSAVPGVHYNMITSGNTVTIPAGEFFAEIDYEVITENFATDEVQTLTFEIVGVDDPVDINPNYSTITINTRKECSFDIANFIGPYSCLEPGYATYDVTITQIDDVTIQVENFWDFGGVITYEFDDAGSVSIPVQETVMGGNTYEVQGSGTYDACTGVFVVDYTVADGGGVVDDNTHTYTPQ